ncbi:alpha/beta hydrolase [Akkermansiaceae bacterium]|nr:alpha/beta hydrolase [Akkermansiaceae bacterium]
MQVNHHSTPLEQSWQSLTHSASSISEEQQQCDSILYLEKHLVDEKLSASLESIPESIPIPVTIPLGFPSLSTLKNTMENLLFDFLHKHCKLSSEAVVPALSLLVKLDQSSAFKQSLLQKFDSIEFTELIEKSYLLNISTTSVNNLASPPFSIQFNLPYFSEGEERQSFDIYKSNTLAIQEGSKDPRPVVLYFHGGAWAHGDKYAAIKRLRHFSSLGVTFISVGYRLAPKHIWPAQLEDAELALEHILENADSYNIDPHKMVLWGSSSGGHIATMLAAKQADKVKGLINLCAPITIDSYMESLVPEDQEKSPVFHLLGGNKFPQKARQELAESASPMRFMTPPFPPSLVIHGTSDTTVPIEQSVILHQKLQTISSHSSLLRLHNSPHRLDDLRIIEPVTSFISDLIAE